MLPLWLSELIVVVALGLEAAFYRFYVVLTVCYGAAVAVVDWDVLGVYFRTWDRVHWGFVFKELSEIRDEFFEEDWTDAFGFEGRYS